MSRPIPTQMLQELAEIFGERLSTALAVREHHGRDESPLDVAPPQAVVFVRSTAEVARLMKLAHRFEVPVIPYGSGTSLEGHLLAVQGGISVDISQMNQVLRIDSGDMTATVEAGVTRKALNEALRHEGLFFPIDPGADASLGGMCATRASGTNAVLYGTMRENVHALTVVSATGEIVHTGTRAKKSSSGYDLTRLFIGSEGTLGVITEVTVKLYAQPQAVSAAICQFPSIEAAVRATIQIIQNAIPIARCELLDEMSVVALNRHSKLGLQERPMLLMEFHGTPAGVKEQWEATREIAREFEGGDFSWAATPEERTRLWNARHNCFFALLQLKPGCRAVTTDVCVPISRLADCILATQEDLRASNITAGIVGHVGDGNFHVIVLIDPAKPEERTAAEGINDRLTDRALAMEGTCTGEHGIGLHKMRFLALEHDAAAIDLMRAVKTAFDPKNILNPGKIFAALPAQPV